MKTIKYITTAFQFFKNLIIKTRETKENKVNFTKFGGNLKKTSNAALTQMYAQDNETLFL
jgi:hypothetical protein